VHDPLCPFCGSKLFPKELDNGECTACLKQLPSGFVVNPTSPTRMGPSPIPVEPVLRQTLWTDEWWGGVRAGLDCSASGVIVHLLSTLAFILWVFALPLLSPVAQLVGVVLVLIPYLGFAAAAFMRFIGACFNCTAPRSSGTRGRTIGAVVCVGLAGCALSLLFFAAFVSSLDLPRTGEGFRELARLCLLVTVVLSISGDICHFTFLRKIAGRTGGSFLARSILICAALCIIAGVCLLNELTSPRAAVAAVRSGPLPIVVFFGVFVSVVATDVWHIGLIWKLRGRIAKWCYGTDF
jgi:hypothetical protein